MTLTYEMCRALFSLSHRMVPNRLLHPISNLVGRVIKKPIDKIKRPDDMLPKDVDGVVVFMVNCDFSKAGLKNMIALFRKYKIKPTLAIAESELSEYADELEGFDFDLASHTLGHDKIYLPSMSKEQQLKEINASKHIAEMYLNKCPKGFVAPYVAYNADTKDLLSKTEFSWITDNNSFYPKEEHGLLNLPRRIELSEPHSAKWRSLFDEFIRQRGIFITFWHCFHFEDPANLKNYEDLIKMTLSNQNIWVTTATQYAEWWKNERTD